MDNKPEQLPFLAKTPIIILNLLFLFPLGLYFMWKYQRFSKPVRIVVTIVVVGFFIHATLKKQGFI